MPLVRARRLLASTVLALGALAVGGPFAAASAAVSEPAGGERCAAVLYEVDAASAAGLVDAVSAGGEEQSSIWSAAAGGRSAALTGSDRWHVSGSDQVFLSVWAPRLTVDTSAGVPKPALHETADGAVLVGPLKTGSWSSAAGFRTSGGGCAGQLILVGADGRLRSWASMVGFALIALATIGLVLRQRRWTTAGRRPVATAALLGAALAGGSALILSQAPAWSPFQPWPAVAAGAGLLAGAATAGLLRRQRAASAARALLADAGAEVLAGRYRLVGVIGAGSTGTVYLADDLDAAAGEAPAVAVKVLAERLTASPDWVSSFRLEAEALRELAHPHISRLRDVVDEDGLVALVSDYVPGSTLRVLCEQATRPTPEQLLGVVSGALRGLGHLHDRGFVHRDVKPENVLLDVDGRSLLTDLGLVVQAGGGQDAGPFGAGSPAYSSPEQLTGEPVDARSDVFSMGVLLHEVLTGRRPFEGSSPGELELAILGHPPDLQRVAAVVGPDVTAVIGRALSKDPEHRQADASVLREELEQAAGQRFGPDWLRLAALAAAGPAASGAARGVVGALAGPAGAAQGGLVAPTVALGRLPAAVTEESTVTVTVTVTGTGAAGGHAVVGAGTSWLVKAAAVALGTVLAVGSVTLPATAGDIPSHAVDRALAERIAQTAWASLQAGYSSGSPARLAERFAADGLASATQVVENRHPGALPGLDVRSTIALDAAGPAPASFLVAGVVPGWLQGSSTTVNDEDLPPLTDRGGDGEGNTPAVLLFSDLPGEGWRATMLLLLDAPLGQLPVEAHARPAKADSTLASLYADWMNEAASSKQAPTGVFAPGPHTTGRLEDFEVPSVGPEYDRALGHGHNDWTFTHTGPPAWSVAAGRGRLSLFEVSVRQDKGWRNPNCVATTADGYFVRWTEYRNLLQGVDDPADGFDKHYDVGIDFSREQWEGRESVLVYEPADGGLLQVLGADSTVTKVTKQVCTSPRPFDFVEGEF